MSSSLVERIAATPVHAAGLLFVLLTAGCAGLEREPAPQAATAPAEEVVTVAPTVADEPVVYSVPPAVAAEPVVSPSVVSPVVEPTARPTTPAAPRTTETSSAKTQVASAKPSAQPPVTPVVAEPPQKKDSPAPRSGQQQAALDMAALEKRLRDTKAIGVFTKITLKNQVDDLLNQFRAFYQGRAKITLVELRQAYDRLLLKVLSLLQDGDQALASEIVASRDAIWGILTDPVKFASL